MIKNLEEMKCVIFEEWSFDPPAGKSSFYYNEIASSYEDMMWIIDELQDHLSECIDEPKMQEFNELLSRKSPTYDYLSNFYFDDGGVGCKCVLLATGKDIGPALIDFIETRLEFQLDEYLDEKRAHVKAFDTIKSNPSDIDNMKKLIKLLSNLIESNNDW